MRPRFVWAALTTSKKVALWGIAILLAVTLAVGATIFVVLSDHADLHIGGVIEDENGKPVPGGHAVFTNLDTHQSVTAIAGKNGGYDLVLPSAGEYQGEEFAPDGRSLFKWKGEIFLHTPAHGVMTSTHDVADCGTFSDIKLEDRIVACDKLITADPENARAYYDKGEILSSASRNNAQGKKAWSPRAAEALNKYVELAPNGRNARYAWRMLEETDPTNETTFNRHLAPLIRLSMESHGRLVAYNNFDLAVISSGTVFHIPAERLKTRFDEGCSGPALSPDGHQVAFVREDRNYHDEIWIFDLRHGRARKVAAYTHSVDSITWSPAGDALAVRIVDELRVLRLPSGQSKLLARYYDEIPSWSPDGHKIVYGSEHILKVFDLRTGRVSDLRTDRAPDFEMGRCPSWSPRGDRITYADSEGHITVLDLRTARTHDLASGECPSWSSRGDWIVYEGHAPEAEDGPRAYMSLPAGGGQSSPLIGAKHPVMTLSMIWSPDERFIAVSSRSESGGFETGGYDITLTDLTTAKTTTLTSRDYWRLASWR